MLLLVAFLSLFPAALAWAVARGAPGGAGGETVRLLLILPAGWALAEWVRGWLFTGFPWLNIGYTQIDAPLAGYAPLLGIYGQVSREGEVIHLIARRLVDRSALLGALTPRSRDFH